MDNGGNDILISITPSNVDLDVLTATFDDHPRFQVSLKQAAILILPTDLRPEYEGSAFPSGTTEVFSFLSENLNDQFTLEAAVLDEDYMEFEYRSETIILPEISIAHAVLLPLVVNLLGTFITKLIQDRRSSKSESKVKCQLHFEGASGEKLSLDYEGPADTFERIVLQEINSQESPPNEGGSSDKNE